ncbi:SH3 domain-containing protein [Microcoleus sp. FACHB-SPT15]|uniref:SH3 domain-containing protein n=1 Tax=Microcoleus sp. FACHB-SPT15 TaxID=2692830 RepID=UPI00177C2BB2|nr:SH3 domain-containing protein [Microcoleus sp. FACHB-SPT15]MBD1807503.1 SH3 domain-containing protein [Microcoleus sp. FACHB-SPT15]
MKQMINWQTSVAVTASIALAWTAFPVSSTVASTATPLEIQPSAPSQTSVQNQAEYKLAQASDNCRRVDTRSSNLNVRSSPGGSIIGSLTDKSLVSIENTGSNGWVPISSPRQGYVFGAYLNLCEQPVPPSETATLLDNCRQVGVTGSIRVREEASISSPIIGTLANRQRVTIVNRGENGWVPISEPVMGYISGADLKYCS